MLIKKILLVFISISMIFSCTGCKDKVELEEQAYVAAIGIDKGKKDKLSVTYQIINAKYGGGPSSANSTSNQLKNETITFDAPDLIVARDMANIMVAKRINLAHTKVFIIGEEFAKSPEFFHFVEASLRDREIRRGTNIIVSRERAEEFLNRNDPKLEDRVNKYFDFMMDRWRDTGLLPVSNLNKFMQRIEAGESLFLSVYATTKKYSEKEAGNEADFLPGQLAITSANPTQMIGSAVFKNGKMIGSLTGNETRLAVLLRPKAEAKSMLMSFEDPLESKYRISARVIKRKKNKIKIDISGEKPIAKVTVPINIEILSIPSFAKYPEMMKNQEVLKNSIAKELEAKTQSLVAKTKSEYGGEPFLWSYIVRKKFWTIDEYYKYNWMGEYYKTQVAVKYNINIKGFGKQLNPPSETK